MPGPRDWQPPRVPEERLVRYFGFRAPPPRVQVERDPLEDHGLYGVANILAGTFALVSMLVIYFCRAVAWLVRRIRPRP